MKPNHPITFTTRAFTFGERLYAQKGAQGDLEAMMRLFVARSDLTEDEMLALVDEEIAEVADLFKKSVEQCGTLGEIGRSLGAG